MNEEQAARIMGEIKEQFPHVETVLVPYMGYFLIGVYASGRYDKDNHFSIDSETDWENIKRAAKVLAPHVQA